MKKQKVSLAFLLLYGALVCLPVLAQEQQSDRNAELSLRKKELEDIRKEVCDQLAAMPRTHYLSSNSNRIFRDYAQNFDKRLNAKLDKSPTSQSGFVTFFVTISSNGDLAKLDVANSSGSEGMPELVKRLIQSNAPFPKFSPKMTSSADELFFVRTVQSKGFHIPRTLHQSVSAEEVRESSERVKELTERHEKLYKETCVSRN